MITASIIVLALIITLAVRALEPTSAPAAHQLAAPRYVQITPLSDGLNCPVDIAWSPDGARVAVLGYSSHCPDSTSGPGVSYTSGLLLIYNAKTGRPEQRATLDPLATAGGVTFDTHTQYLAYQALLWSSDGARLALPFFVQHGTITPASPYTSVHGVDTSTAPQSTVAGVLLLNAATLQRTALLSAPDATMVSASAALEWNVTTGQLIHPALQLPPALGYQWGAGGALTPTGLLSAGQVPTPITPTPVGNPSGGASFSVWQPGQTGAGRAQVNGVSDFVPGLDLFFSHFAAWSPDGAYLLTPAYYGGRIDTFQPPQPTAAQTQAAGWANVPILPVCDAALAALYNSPGAVDISWSPNGQTLAAWNSAANGAGAPQLGLYNAASGRLSTSLPVPAAATAQLDTSLNVDDTLRWSADGTHLALISASLSSLIIWQTH